MTKEQFGKRIVQLRIHFGLSQHALADKCDMYPGQIANLESGQNSPTLVTIEKIAQGFGISASQLIADDEPIPSPYSASIHKVIACMQDMSDEDQANICALVKLFKQSIDAHKTE